MYCKPLLPAVFLFPRWPALVETLPSSFGRPPPAWNIVMAGKERVLDCPYYDLGVWFLLEILERTDMLGKFVTRVLVSLLGYAYPAFECFREIEKNSPEIEQLRFWCQYWIVMGLLTALERFGDMFISWLPLYGEAKLAFIIYLWHPRTKGTWYIYYRFIMPCLTKHEPYINTRLQQIRTKSGDLLLFYLRSFTQRGQSLASDFLHYVVRQGSSSTSKDGVPTPPNGPRPTPSPAPPPLQMRQSIRSRRHPS